MSKILSIFKVFSKIFSGGGNWIFGVLMIISLFSKKKKQETTTTATTNNYQSPTYSWDNIANTSEVDAPLPIVFGTHKVGGNIINTHIITNITKQDKIINSTIEPASLTYDNINKKITCHLATGGIEKLDLLIGVKNYGSLPEKESVNIYIEISKTTGGAVLYSLNHLFKGNGDSNQFTAYDSRGTNNFTATINSLDKTYTAGYDVSLTYLPNSTINSNGYNEYSATRYFGVVLPLSYNKMDGVITLGSTNEYSAQTLQMDVGLSVGQIRSVKSITINDQPVSGYTSVDKYGQNEIRIGFDWKCGHEFLIEENLNKTIAGQSAVFNQNKVLSRLWAVLITQPAPLGATSITVADNSIFVKEDGTGYNDLYIGITGGVAQAVSGISGNDIVNLVNPNTVAVASAGSAWARVNSDDTTIKDTGKFTDFDYVTQFNYSDGIDLALVCPNGLYIINQETGAYLSNNITYHVYVAHDEIWDDGLTHDIKASGVCFYSKEITVTGNRRGKIWYNYQINDLPASASGKKKYRIKVRKVSRDSVDSSINMNDLNIAYVEEIKNKDLYYNGLGYATLNMPADPRLNGGNPSFAFTIDGVRVPKLLHESLKIDTITDGNTVINIANVDGTTKNAVSGGTEYALNTPFLFISGTGRLAVNEEYNDIFTHGGFTSRTGNYRFSNIVTCYFKCGNAWHKRYCYFGNTYEGGDSSVPTKHLGRFVILTYANILTMIATPTTWFDGLQYSNHDEDLLKIKDYMDSDPYLKEFNTALPSQPTDMITYTWSANPANALLYLLIDENGLKVPIQYIDLDSFREAEAYFNEPVYDLLNLGKTIPRCELNFVIDTISNIRNHIEKICTTCHSSLLESNGKIKLKIDKQGTSEYFIDEDTHILPNSFKIVSLPDKDLPNQINISFLNEAKDYAKEIITIEDVSVIKQYGEQHIRKLDMDLYGVTSASQVYREGLLLLKQAKYIQYTAVFKTSVSGFPLEVGTIFKLRSSTHGFGDPNDPTDGKLVRVMNIKYDEKQECEVTVIEYFDSIYEITNEDKLSFPVVTHSELPNPSKKPMPVKNLTLTEYNEQTNSGDVITSIVGTFQTPDRPTYLNNNMIAFLGITAASGASTVYLRTLDEAKKLNLGDKVGFNSFVSDANIVTLESLIPIANMIPNSPAMKITVDAAAADVAALYASLTPYTIQSIDYSQGAITISPALTQAYAVDSFLTTISYTSANKYEFSKYSHVVASLIKVETSGAHTVIFDKEKFEGSLIKFVVPELGTYFTTVYAVSSNGMVGDPVVSSNITLIGKQLAPNAVTSATATIFKYKHVYKINWTDITNKDTRNYRVDIIDTSTQTTISSKTIIYPLEDIYTFTASGNYDIKIYAVNTSGIVSPAYTINKDVVVEITENITLSYTLRGNLIVASWTPVEVATELVRYAIYIRKTTPFATEGSGEFDPNTNPYLESDYQGHKVWEGTSTQISIGNLTDGSIITYDEPYHLFVLAKYKYNGVEKVRHAVQVTIEPVSDANASVLIYAVMPDIVDGILAQGNLKVYAVAIPDAAVTRVYGTLERYVDGEPMVTLVEFTKNVDDLWECEFEDLVDADWTLYIYGEKVTGDKTATVQLKFTVDTSIPAPLPRPYITKDNTYVQTQTLAYSATLTTPISNGETIDIYNSKTIQVCLPTFTTCTNFSHIKMYLREYDSSTKSWGAYTEYKLPQSPLQEEQIVPNFKASVTFAEDMPDFQIKLVQVKKTGLEGVLGNTLASLRSKIDTTPPLIKINSISYDGDTASFNAVNNNYINAKLNVGLGLLINLSITENNSGLWSNMVDEALLRMPVYYQINNGTKTPLKNASGLYANTFLIPKAAFTGINEGEKVNITIFALDNALKLGNTTFTKILDTTAPQPVTLAKAVFGVEANAKVIKFRWTASVSTDVAGVRIYEGTTLIKETTGTSASIPTTDGTTRNFVLRAYDFANNESEDLAVSAVNYKPAQVTGLVASSDSSSVSLKWTAVTLDTDEPPELMTDLDYYEVSYYNPNTGTTVTAQTKDTHFYIPMTASDMAYFNTYLNKYITDIKVRAIDIFGGVSGTGDWSATTIARPRFIEAVDMTQNIFKFVPSLVGCTLSSGSLEYLVDANYKNSESAVIANISQGDSIHIDMKPEYVAETKVKFYGAVTGAGSYIKFLIKYRVIDPVTRVESDLYIQSASGYNDLVHLETNSVADYARHLKVQLTNAGTDKENTFVISLFQSALVRKSYYIKAVDLIFAVTEYAVIGVCELQPRVRSIANDFYGETMLLSNMLAIRSSEDTSNYLNMTSTYLEMYNGGNKSLVLGDLANVGGSGYGLWAKDNIYLGGTTAANAHVNINTSYIGIGKTGSYYNTKIESNAITMGYNAATSQYDIAMTYAPVLGGIVRIGSLPGGVYHNIYIYHSGILLGYASNGYYNTEITASTIKLGYHANGYATIIDSSEIKMKLPSESNYNLSITSGQIGIGYTGGYYNTKITSGALYLGHLSSGTSYAMTMDYSGAEASRYFSIKGADLSEYFRVSKLLINNTLINTVWSKYLFVSEQYTNNPTYFDRAESKVFVYSYRSDPAAIFSNAYNTGVGGGAGIAILAHSNHGSAIRAISPYNTAIRAEGAADYYGVHGYSPWATGAGIYGDNYTGTGNAGLGVYGRSMYGTGVKGESTYGYGVHAISSSSYALYAISTSSVAIYGTTTGANQSAVVGYTTATNSNGVHGESSSGRGVDGYSASNNGVVGRTGSNSTYGGLFQGASTSGYALRTEARVIMTNLSVGTGTALVISSNEVKVSSSSIRYKTLLERADVDFTINKFMCLIPYKFMFNISGDYDIGFVAEHVLSIFPDLVMFNSDGQPESLKYDRFSVYTVLAVQEHEKVIQTQKSEINALKTSIEELKKLVDNLMNK